MKKPFFSIVCPTYNSADFIERTLENVFKQLFTDFELIISDDGSIDFTCALIEQFKQKNPSYSITLLRNEHLGPGAARNFGIASAAGKWIAFLDSDDLWEENKLQRIKAFIDEQKDLVNFICHNEIHIKRDGSYQAPQLGKYYERNKPLFKQLYVRNFISTSTVTCQKYLLDTVAKFDITLSSSQDFELWLSLADHMNLLFVDEVLGKYIDRENNISSQKLWKRLCNLIKIYTWHRKRAGISLYMAQCLKTILYFGLAYGRSVVKSGRQKAIQILKRSISLLFPLFQLIEKIHTWLLGSTRVVVLLYHGILQDQFAAFARQIDYLQKYYDFIDIDTFEAILAGRKKYKKTQLLLTFDDGFKSNRQVCDEILAPRGIRAVLFVLPDLITAEYDKVLDIINDGIFAGQKKFLKLPAEFIPLNKIDIEHLIAMGHIIGSHSKSHARLAELSTEKQRRGEIIDSANLLEKMFNITVQHFAYPFGDNASIDKSSMQIACERYNYIFSGVRGSNRGDSFAKVIFRNEILPDYSLSQVRAIIEGGFSLFYSRARRVLRKMAGAE